MELTDLERSLLREQSHSLQGNTGCDVVCECGGTFNILDMYRCLYCGVYRCISCSEEHFGITVKEWKEKER